jgi:hypothetical protein
VPAVAGVVGGCVAAVMLADAHGTALGVVPSAAVVAFRSRMRTLNLPFGAGTGLGGGGGIRMLAALLAGTDGCGVTAGPSESCLPSVLRSLEAA